LALLSLAVSETLSYTGKESAEGIVEAKTEGQKRAGRVKRRQKREPSLVNPIAERGDNPSLATGMMLGGAGRPVNAQNCRAADAPLRRGIDKWQDMQERVGAGMTEEGEEGDIRRARHRVHRGCGAAPRP